MSLDAALIEQYTQGVNAPTVDQDGYFAKAKVSSGVPNLAYVPGIEALGYHRVSTIDDLLPYADDDTGVITLPTNSGLWGFDQFVDGESDYTLVAMEGAVLWSMFPNAGFRATTSSAPAVTVKNHLNAFPFQ